MVIRITPAGKMPAVRECLLCHARCWRAFLWQIAVLGITAPPTCPEIPCAGSVHLVSENGAFCPQGPEIRPARPYPQTGGNRPPQTFLGGGNYPVGMRICTDSVLAAAVCAGNRIQAGNYFSGSGSAVYDGRCLLMNETARKLMKRIDDARITWMM